MVAPPHGTSAFLEAILAPIRDDLNEVEEILSVEISSSHPLMQALSRYVSGWRGKRLRPAMVLLAARAAGELDPEHRRLAAVTEILHTATLVHDDILDDADLRRRHDTVNRKWDNPVAVIFGDFLFSAAFSLIVTFRDREVQSGLAQATRDMCEGEMLQLQDRRDRRFPSEAEYLEMVRLKTASFLAWCCGLGAHMAGGAPETVRALHTFGEEFGTAFQIIDDCLDLSGQEHRMGKSLGTDVTTGKCTLPVLRALPELDPEERARIESIFWERNGNPAAKKEAIRQIAARGGGLDAARTVAAEHARRAIAALAVLPDSPARDALRGMAEFIQQRDF